ncbi:50S ribosomal subunit protein L3 (fragment) [uncultured Thiomicrorhabdus sp.]
MSIGIIGKKIGMTRVFNDEGVSTPVTVVQVNPNRITQIKTVDTDGYSAIQVTTGSVHAGRVSKPAAGHFAKAGVEAGEGLWEFRASLHDGTEYVSQAVEQSIDQQA